MNKLSKMICILAITSVLIISIASYIIVTSPAPTGPGPIELEVQADKPSYLVGENVTFSIYVYNPQNWSVFYPSSMMYSIGTDSRGANFGYAAPFPVFQPHSKTLFYTHTWRTELSNGTLIEPGNYTFSVSLDGRVDYGVPANCTVTIREGY